MPNSSHVIERVIREHKQCHCVFAASVLTLLFACLSVYSQYFQVFGSLVSNVLESGFSVFLADKTRANM